MKKEQFNIYEKYVKRVLDFILSGLAIIFFSPLLLLLTVMGAVAMKGNPFFVQFRPGRNEHIFSMIKFRTMTNEKDAEGNLLPDNERLNPYGKFLRSSSLDELPELFNIFVGNMSIVGPRPQLVRDMVFMTQEQRRRHSVRQGLTGLAQVSGRNGVTWEEKIELDIKYIENISFGNDLKIIIKTIGKVITREGIATEGMETAEDFGDYLFHKGEISEMLYMEKQKEAKDILKKYHEKTF